MPDLSELIDKQREIVSQAQSDLDPKERESSQHLVNMVDKLATLEHIVTDGKRV